MRDALIAAAHGYKLAGFLGVLVVCGTATALAAWLVRRYSPHASGSGIPHVEAVLNGALKPVPIGLVPVNSSEASSPLVPASTRP
jgi:CIC family chloride channel protein